MPTGILHAREYAEKGEEIYIAYNNILSSASSHLPTNPKISTKIISAEAPMAEICFLHYSLPSCPLPDFFSLLETPSPNNKPKKTRRVTKDIPRAPRVITPAMKKKINL